MQTDNNHKLYLYLPANVANQTTTAVIAADGMACNSYNCTVDNSNISVLKMDQSELTINGVKPLDPRPARKIHTPSNSTYRSYGR